MNEPPIELLTIEYAAGQRQPWRIVRIDANGQRHVQFYPSRESAVREAAHQRARASKRYQDAVKHANYVLREEFTYEEERLKQEAPDGTS